MVRTGGAFERILLVFYVKFDGRYFSDKLIRAQENDLIF
jgi:hypothetical protein